MTSPKDVVAACFDLAGAVSKALANLTQYPSPGERAALQSQNFQLVAVHKELLGGQAQLEALPVKLRDAAERRARGAADLLGKAIFPTERKHAIDETWAAVALLDMLI